MNPAAATVLACFVSCAIAGFLGVCITGYCIAVCATLTWDWLCDTFRRFK